MTTIFWAGDSTVKQNGIATYPQTGIGQAFTRFVKPFEVRVENHAENGRSTKSFLTEGRMAEIYDRITCGDFLFVQFGHNDEKADDPTRYTAPDGEFPVLLTKFVNVARNKGANPVLITPVTRYDRAHSPWQHGPWAQAVRDLGKKLDVPVIDLTALSEKAVDEAGEDVCTKWYMHLPAGVYAQYPEGLADHTHLQTAGALYFAGLIAGELLKLGGAYADLIDDEAIAWCKGEEQA